MTKSKSEGATAKAAAHMDAIAMLVADHKKVKGLFERFKSLHEDGGDDDEKREVVQQICNELKIHTQIEEEIFYPAVKQAIDDEDLMDEALVEHAGAKQLIEQLEGVTPDDELYDAKVTVLGEQIDHHVEEEEGNMFPEAKKSSLDTAALGADMAQRKAALTAKLSLTADDEDAANDEEATPKRRATSKR